MSKELTAAEQKVNETQPKINGQKKKRYTIKDSIGCYRIIFAQYFENLYTRFFKNEDKNKYRKELEVLTERKRSDYEYWANIDKENSDVLQDIKNLQDSKNDFTFYMHLIEKIRSMKKLSKVKGKAKISIKCKQEIADEMNKNHWYLFGMTGTECVEISDSVKKAKDSIVESFNGIEIHIHGAVELDEKSIEKKKNAIIEKINSINTRLNNPGYIRKAPQKLVAESQSELIKLEKELESLNS